MKFFRNYDVAYLNSVENINENNLKSQKIPMKNEK